MSKLQRKIEDWILNNEKLFLCLFTVCGAIGLFCLYAGVVYVDYWFKSEVLHIPYCLSGGVR